MQALHTGICSPGELRQTEATGRFPNYQPEAFPSIGPLRLLGLLLGSRSPSEGVGTEGTPSSLSAAMTPLAPSQLSIGTQRLPLSLPGATLIRMGRVSGSRSRSVNFRSQWSCGAWGLRALSVYWLAVPTSEATPLVGFSGASGRRLRRR